MSLNMQGLAIRTDRSRYTKNIRSNGQTSLMIPLSIRKNLTIIPVTKTTIDSSKQTGRDKKEMVNKLCQSEKPYAHSNLKISKEVTLNPINDKENNVMDILNKLPDITFDVVKSASVFKVPETPKFIKKNKKTNTTPANKSRVTFERKVLSDRQDDNIIDKNPVFINNIENHTKIHSNPKNNMKINQKQDINIPVIKPETVPKKYSGSEKETKQRTSSPNMFSKNSTKFSKIKPIQIKIVKLAKEIPNTSVSHKVNTISDKDSITHSNEDIHYTEIETNESTNDDYMLMDLSTEGKINIIPASRPSDFMNVIVPEYDSFVKGISKSPEDYSKHIETSQNYIERGSNALDLTYFTDNLDYSNSSPYINKINNYQSDLGSQTYSVENGLLCSTTNGQNPYPYLYNDLLTKSSLQNNEMDYTTDSSIISTEKQSILLQEMGNFLGSNLNEKIELQNELNNYTKSVQDKLLNTFQETSDVENNENKNVFKRRQIENEFYKKQKTDNEIKL